MAPGASRFRLRRWLIGLTAVAAAVVAGLLWLRSPGELASAPTLQGAVYSLEVSGLAERRGAAESVRATAYPDTEVRVSLRAVRGERAGTHYGLFVGGERGLVRADDDPRIAVDAQRGRVSWSGPARALVGDAPGTYALFVVAAPSALPDDITVPNPDAGRVEAVLPEARAYVQTLTILKTPVAP